MKFSIFTILVFLSLVCMTAFSSGQNEEEIFGLLRSLKAGKNYEADFQKIKQYISEKKGDLNQTDANGNRIIHWATMFDQYCIVKMLLDNNVDTNVLDQNGDSPLKIAFENNSSAGYSIGHLLAEKGADLNRVYKNKKTLLHLATEHVRVKWVVLLLKYNADRNILDSFGKKPIDYAIYLSLKHIGSLLQNKITAVDIDMMYSEAIRICEESRKGTRSSEAFMYFEKISPPTNSPEYALLNYYYYPTYVYQEYNKYIDTMVVDVNGNKVFKVNVKELISTKADTIFSCNARIEAENTLTSFLSDFCDSGYYDDLFSARVISINKNTVSPTEVHINLIEKISFVYNEESGYFKLDGEIDRKNGYFVASPCKIYEMFSTDYHMCTAESIIHNYKVINWSPIEFWLSECEDHEGLVVQNISKDFELKLIDNKWKICSVKTKIIDSLLYVSTFITDNDIC